MFHAYKVSIFDLLFLLLWVFCQQRFDNLLSTMSTPSTSGQSGRKRVEYPVPIKKATLLDGCRNIGPYVCLAARRPYL